MSRPQRAVIYTRISRDSNSLGEGVAIQEKRCRELADRLGCEVLQVFEENDVGASTSSRKPRPRYEAMVQAMAAGQIDLVLAYSHSRLTRRLVEFIELIELSNKTGVLFKTCVSGDPDLTTADGRATALTLATWDQAEAERTAERVRANVLHRASQGKYTGPRPFGYDFAVDEAGRVLTGHERALTINPAEAAVIRECVQWILDGEGLWSVAKKLNNRGVRTASGGPWQSQPLRRMLMRWVHAGYRKHQAFKNGKWTGPVQLHEAEWEPIIDRQTHERVIAKLTDPARTTNRGDTELKYLLTWLANCGVCGRPVAGAKGYEYQVKGYRRVDGTRSPSKVRNYQPRYSCQHPGCHGVTRRMDVVDEMVERVVVGLLEREGVEVFGGDQSTATAAREQIDQLKAKLALISDAWMDGDMTQEQFQRQNRRLMDQLKEAEVRLRGSQPASELTEFTTTNPAAAWHQADVKKKRMVIKALMEMTGLKIVIDPIGPGAFSNGTASPYSGIRVEPGKAPGAGNRL